ncbi:hypothetical protein [Vibrio penaeicida]|uniref:hypothetical protein n=2 Tax=Vibrio penaeicida TaxID=104609 RepID=UPI000CEA2431|nr:hypothetical protein [Vibrio penaeicida]
MKQQSRLRLLNSAINNWLELPKTSRATITAEIIEVVERIGLTSVLEEQGITFNQSDDIYNDMRVNAQKLFRWLGHYDGIHDFKDRIWDIEQAIVAALPCDIRIQYLNDVYALPDLYIGTTSQQKDHLNCDRIAASLTKENMEAQLSVIELRDNPESSPSIYKAHRELKESVATTLAAIDVLEHHYPELSNLHDNHGRRRL